MSRGYRKDVPMLFDVEPLVDHFRQRGKPTVDAVHTAMCHLDRNLSPVLLQRLYEERLLTRRAATRWVGQAWSGCEFPETALDAEEWQYLFWRAGFTVDGRRADLPDAPLVLYRGATYERRDGWSWTDDIEVARWFARRINGEGWQTYCSFQGPAFHRVRESPAVVWKATVEPDRLYAGNLSARRGEPEYVIDTDGLDITEYASA